MRYLLLFATTVTIAACSQSAQSSPAASGPPAADCAALARLLEHQAEGISTADDYQFADPWPSPPGYPKLYDDAVGIAFGSTLYGATPSPYDLKTEAADIKASPLAECPASKQLP